MPENVDFLREDPEPVETDKAIVALMDPDEIVKHHEALVIQGVPESLMLIGDDGTEIPYRRLPDPKCSICKSLQCQEAERVYINTGFDLKAVVDFFKNSGIKMSSLTVRKHFKVHCNFGDLEENWLAVAQHRKDEIIQHNNELTEILMGDIMDTIIWVKQKAKGIDDIKDLTQMLGVLARLHQVMQQYEKIRTEKKEFEIQVHDAIYKEQQDSIKELFASLLNNAQTEAEKSRIATALSNFFGRR